MKNKQKDFGQLTPQEVTLFYDKFKQVAEKYENTDLSNGKKDTHIKLELKSLIGMSGIKLNKNSYNNQVTKALRKFRDRQTQPFDTTNVSDVVSKPVVSSPVKATPNSAKPSPSTPAENATPKTTNAVDKFPVISPPVYTRTAKMLHDSNPTYSVGEKFVADKLEDLNIRFNHEVELDGLVSEKDATFHLPCDFVLDIDGRIAVIEFNGQQHYEVWDDVETYARLVTNDARRLKFALDNGIPYLVIHYKDGVKSTINNIINEFISDVKKQRTTSMKYTARTYGHFGTYDASNNARYKDVFPNTSFPHMEKNEAVGYIQIDAEKIIIWDKSSLEMLLTSNDDLNNKANRLYVQNKSLRSELETVSNTVKMVSENYQAKVLENSELQAKVNELEAQLESIDTHAAPELIPTEPNEDQDKVVVVEGKEYAIPRSLLDTQSGKPLTEPDKEFIRHLARNMSINDAYNMLNHNGVKVSKTTVRKYMKEILD